MYGHYVNKLDPHILNILAALDSDEAWAVLIAIDEEGIATTEQLMEIFKCERDEIEFYIDKLNEGECIVCRNGAHSVTEFTVELIRRIFDATLPPIDQKV